MSLLVSNLHVAVDGKEIVHGVSFDVAPKSVHAVMGPNGSGKSTCAFALAGHPHYTITEGRVEVDDADVTGASPDERARAGLFLSFQHPVSVPGVPVRQFLRTAYNALHKTHIDPLAFSRTLKTEMNALKLNSDFAKRSINEGFSGGEKKRLEMLQLAILKPRYAVLDETDSGLDVDAIQLVAQTITRAKEQGTGIILITDYSRILRFVVPDVVHILANGNLVKQGDASLAHAVEESGYESFTR